MTEQEGQHSEQYREARRRFDDLKMEDKAVFLLESTVSTLARGIEEFSRAVADSLEKTFEEAERRREKQQQKEEEPRPAPPSGGPENGTSGVE